LTGALPVVIGMPNGSGAAERGDEFHPLPILACGAKPFRMPLINVYTSAEALPREPASALLRELSALVARHLKKPERYVMTVLVSGCPMTLGGDTTPSCHVELKSIGGLTPAVNRALSQELCTKLSQALGVAPDRIYVVFADIPAQAWGHSGGTFG
jgi:phenylpyruvate tautomerase PptA (4-oxalocrotonate tautomerase family)